MDAINGVSPPSGGKIEVEIPTEDDEMMLLMNQAMSSIQESHENCNSALKSEKNAELEETTVTKHEEKAEQEETTGAKHEENAEQEETTVTKHEEKAEHQDQVAATNDNRASTAESHKQDAVVTERMEVHVAEKKEEHVSTLKVLTADQIKTSSLSSANKITAYADVQQFKSQVVNLEDLLKNDKLTFCADYTMVDIEKLHKKQAVGLIDVKNCVIKVPQGHPAAGATKKIPINGELVDFKLQEMTDEETKQLKDVLYVCFTIEAKFKAVDNEKLNGVKQTKVVFKITVGAIGNERSKTIRDIGERKLKTSKHVTLAETSGTLSSFIRKTEKNEYKEKIAEKNEKTRVEKLEANLEYDKEYYENQYLIFVDLLKEIDVNKSEFGTELKNVLIYPIEKWNFGIEKQAELIQLDTLHSGASEIANIYNSAIEVLNNDKLDSRFKEIIKQRLEIIRNSIIDNNP